MVGFEVTPEGLAEKGSVRSFANRKKPGLRTTVRRLGAERVLFHLPPVEIRRVSQSHQKRQR